MKGVVVVSVDGLPEGSEVEFADAFQELLKIIAGGMPLGVTVAVEATVGSVVRRGAIRVTSQQKTLPRPRKGRPAPRRSPTARGPPPPPGKVGLSSGLLNRPRPRRWRGPPQ